VTKWEWDGNGSFHVADAFSGKVKVTRELLGCKGRVDIIGWGALYTNSRAWWQHYQEDYESEIIQDGHIIITSPRGDLSDFRGHWKHWEQALGALEGLLFAASPGQQGKRARARKGKGNLCSRRKKKAPNPTPTLNSLSSRRA
jgi:hypothetical protein